MLRTIKYILNHPLTKQTPVRALLGFFKWQFFSRIYKKPVVYNFTANSKLYVWNGLAGATGNIYSGLHEFEDMSFLLHFLRDGDLFVDVGANIGSYTILASAEIGAKTIAFEPVKSTYINLINNISLNQISDKVEPLNIGVSNKKGSLKFTKSFDTGNHVANPDESEFESIEVDSLDSILANKNPSLLKIDVEGFETEVLNGATDILQLESLKAIIIELNGSGNRYGYNDNDTHLKLLENGFKVMKYLPFERKLTDALPSNEHNTLYVRDPKFVAERIRNGKLINIKNKVF